MQLRFIERETPIQLRPEVYSTDYSELFEVSFYELATFTSFWVMGEDLYNNFANLGEKARMFINFSIDHRPYKFLGELKETRMEGNNHLTLVEQIAPIEPVSNRLHAREEIRLAAKVYKLAQEILRGGLPLKAPPKAEYLCEVFDISISGVCLVANELFDSTGESLYLLEFTLGEQDYFLLPAKLVRRGKCPQTTLFNYDYGFDFIFAHKPEEKYRLSDAIFRSKLNRL